MSLRAPWNHLESTLENLQDYSLGSQKLADFFKGMEEKHAPDELLEILFDSGPANKIIERLFFFLFDIGVSDRQVGTRALELRRLRRMWMRIRAGATPTDGEQKLIDGTAPFFNVDKGRIEEGAAAARSAFARLIAHEEVSPEERQALVILIGGEAEGLKDRVDWLSENTDPYNMKTMARVLPRLRIYDEAVHEGLDLAKKLEAREPVGLKILSFQSYMKEAAFDKWLKKVSAKPRFAPLAALLARQLQVKIPTMDLIALATLSRWTWEAIGEKSEPMDWIQKAFDSYEDGKFAVEAGESAKILAPALGSSGAKSIATKITGNFGKKSFPAWIGRDLLTKPYLKAADEGALDMKAVIAQNVTRDSIIESLLSNPKVYQTPGLVAFVAATSRSLAILSRIAKLRELHSGFANREVPLTLLQSPCNIPITLLRNFINVRNVPLVDLKHIARAKAGIRRVVKEETEAYLKARG